ncbi:hypothetical protein EVAR_53520_1 [Eumeta japonica]|uniref:Helitron helicase-like domain-containing protein n=1 Tax=Eumeta variegata TaxID=151549 RepID=A0A4C1Y4N4_EUMVA|nr:hypothetical protein EVAR_53520_1 [Eumeta japonica]
MADQPDEPMDLTDLPPPSTSNVTQDTAVSTSAMPFAEPQITAAPKSKAQKQRDYRHRIAASRTPAEVITARAAETARKRNYRLRVAANSALANEPVQTTSTSSDLVEIQQTKSTWNTKWQLSIKRFKSTFLDNESGYACSVCDRLWFKNDLKPITAANLEVISDWFIKVNRQLCREEYELVCSTLSTVLQQKVDAATGKEDDPSNRTENISAENAPDSEVLASKQHTMMWNEEDCLNIAPGHRAQPLNIIYDRHAEELSFPSIYYGIPRRFNMGVSVTAYMIATSELRRRDRRGATPQKILYVAIKILRLRMVDGILLEDPEFLKEFVTANLAFMKTVPNSIQYWAARKLGLFAMMRQLGKPTVFLTISANEIRWPKLLTILLKLSNKYPGKTAKDLNTSERCTLVSDDPVTCCIYFHKLVGSLMKMLKSKQFYNPFGKYFVQDYFIRIEFQHRGSPHAHILLWLNNDPHETVSENMPKTIDLVEKLSSVSREDMPSDSVYANQSHKHTFTCTK